jgi:hypothetical protein
MEKMLSPEYYLISIFFFINHHPKIEVHEIQYLNCLLIQSNFLNFLTI